MFKTWNFKRIFFNLVNIIIKKNIKTYVKIIKNEIAKKEKDK